MVVTCDAEHVGVSCQALPKGVVAVFSRSHRCIILMLTRSTMRGHAGCEREGRAGGGRQSAVGSVVAGRAPRGTGRAAGVRMGDNRLACWSCDP